MAMTSVNLPVHPLIPSTTFTQQELEDNVMPVTSYLCQWKVPKKRKESTIQMSAAVFEKHDYQKTKKRKTTLIEDFDPCLDECKGT